MTIMFMLLFGGGWLFISELIRIFGRRYIVEVPCFEIESVSSAEVCSQVFWGPILCIGFMYVFLWCLDSLYNVQVETVQKVFQFMCIIILVTFMNYADVFMSGSLNAHSFTFVYISNIVVLVIAMITSSLQFENAKVTLYFIGFLFFSLTLILANDYIMFYLSFEALSLLSYGLIAINKNVGASEASIKYFVYGSIASVFLIFGLTLSYISIGSIEFINMYFYMMNAKEFDVLKGIALVMILLAFCYKLSLFPFHFAITDVYESVSWTTISLINVIIKLPLIIVLVRLIFYWCGEYSYGLTISSSMLLISSISIIIGCIGAILQTSVRRFLAYTSINQAGFILLGVSAGSFIGLQASLIYLVTYMISLVLMLWVVQDKSEIVNLTELQGLPYAKKLILSMILFSMAGIPPFFGFISKYYLWYSLADVTSNVSFHYEITLLALGTSILISLVSAFYYLRLIKVYLFVSTQDIFGVPSNILFDTFKNIQFINPILCINVLVLVAWPFTISYVLYWTELWSLSLMHFNIFCI